MTALAQTALDFARECLGWKDAKTGQDNRGVQYEAVWCIDDSACRELCFTDLTAVMDAVRGWADRQEKPSVSLEYSLTLYTAHIGAGAMRETASAASDNPCHALLAACVAASRKMTGGVGGGSHAGP